MEYKPKEHQRKAAGYIVNHTRCMLCMEPGMGKTSVVLTALNSLKYDCFDKSRIIVITDLINAVNRWIPEMNKWNHLNGLTACKVFSLKDVNKAVGGCDIIFASPEMSGPIIRRIGEGGLTLVIDKAYLLQNASSKEYVMIRSASEKATRMVVICDWNIKANLGILWNILFLIDSGERLGRNRVTFLNRFFYRYYEIRNGHRVCINEPKPQSWATIRSLIRDVCFEVTGWNSRTFNDRTVINRYISLNKEQYSKYLLTARVAEVATSMFGGGKAEAYAEAAAQYADGIVKCDNGEVVLSHMNKINELRRLLEAMPYTRVVIVVPYEFDIDIITENIPGIMEIRKDLDFLRWWAGERLTAIVCQNNKVMSNLLRTFNNGAVITFRNNNFYYNEKTKATKNIMQCNILLNGTCGY